MSDLDTLIFRNHDGVGGYPTHDGFVDLDMLENTGETPETGYIGGSQLTFANGSLPPVLFRGIRNVANGKLMLGFLCRFNVDFHEDDAISIVMKPTFNSVNRADWRKINIYPVGSGGALGAAGISANNIRSNRAPRDTDYFEGSGTDEWIEVAGLPAEVRVKVRSWEHTDLLGNVTDRAWSVELELDPTDASGNWMNVGDDFAIFFKLVKIVNAGTGAATEYIFPLDAPDPLPGDIFAEFLDFYEPTKYGRGLKNTAIPAVPDGIAFENGWQGIGRRPLGSGSTTLESWIETGPTGDGDGLDNQIVALIRNDGTSNATGISAEFRFANWGLGPLGFSAWDAPLGLSPNPTATSSANAGASNIALTANWPMASVRPEYQTVRHQCMWAQLSATSSVNFAQSSVRRNMNFHPLSTAEDQAEVSGKGHPDPANGSGEHDFILQTVSRTINIRNLTKDARLADPNALDLARDTIIATGGLDREDGGDDDKDDGRDVKNDLVARAVTHRMVTARRTQPFTDTVIHVWITEGFRLTNRTITINGTAYPLLDNGCGSFGIAARHEGVKDPLSWSLKGKGLDRYGPQIYGLKVPHKSVTHLDIQWRAEPDGPVGDVSELPTIKAIPEQKWVGTPPGKREGGKGKDTPPRDDSGPGAGGDKGGCAGLIIGLVAVPTAILASLHGTGWL